MDKCERCWKMLHGDDGIFCEDCNVTLCRKCSEGVHSLIERVNHKRHTLPEVKLIVKNDELTLTVSELTEMNKKQDEQINILVSQNESLTGQMTELFTEIDRLKAECSQKQRVIELLQNELKTCRAQGWTTGIKSNVNCNRLEIGRLRVSAPAIAENRDSAVSNYSFEGTPQLQRNQNMPVSYPQNGQPLCASPSASNPQRQTSQHSLDSGVRRGPSNIDFDRNQLQGQGLFQPQQQFPPFCQNQPSQQQKPYYIATRAIPTQQVLSAFGISNPVIAEFSSRNKIDSLLLLYDSLTHTKSGTECHKRIDGKGPTLILVKSKNVSHSPHYISFNQSFIHALLFLTGIILHFFIHFFFSIH